MQPNSSNTFGARFLDAWKRLGGPLGQWSYAEIQELRGCEREEMVACVRRHHALADYRSLQLIREVESPEELARHALGSMQAQAASNASVWIMIGMLS